MRFFQIARRHLCESASVLSHRKETDFAEILGGMKDLKEKSQLQRMMHFAASTVQGQRIGVLFQFWERKCTF